MTPADIALRLLGEPAEEVERLGGGNSSVWRVRTGAGLFALKVYPDDGRPRLAQETSALEFLAEADVDSVPRVVATDASLGAAVFTWIDGSASFPPTRADVDACSRFVGTLKRLRGAPGAEGLRPASAACLEPGDAVQQLDRRIAQLRSAGSHDSDLATFVSDELQPTRDAVVDRVRALSPLERGLPTLSASDFGFHNCRRRPDGRIAFVDFEYFGWDDPCKLVCDFVLHPGMELPAGLRAAFIEGVQPLFEADPGYNHRLDVLAPVFGLIWCAIVLNPLLVRGGDGGDAGRLQRAMARCRRVSEGYRHGFDGVAGLDRAG